MLYAYGEANSEGIVSCYIETLLRLDQGNIEAMCTSSAIVDGW